MTRPGTESVFAGLCADLRGHLQMNALGLSSLFPASGTGPRYEHFSHNVAPAEHFATAIVFFRLCKLA